MDEKKLMELAMQLLEKLNQDDGSSAWIDECQDACDAKTELAEKLIKESGLFAQEDDSTDAVDELAGYVRYVPAHYELAI